MSKILLKDEDLKIGRYGLLRIRRLASFSKVKLTVTNDSGEPVKLGSDDLVVSPQTLTVDGMFIRQCVSIIDSVISAQNVI